MTEVEKRTLKNQIEIMILYAQMMLDREDWHGLWDAAIDLQRLYDKLEMEKNEDVI